MKKALLLTLLLLGLDGSLAVAAAPQEDKHRAAVEEVMTLAQSVVQLYQQGKYKEATALARRAVEVADAGLGPENPLTIAALSNLGALLVQRRELKDAEPVYERILASREKSRAPSAPHLAAALETYLCLLARLEAGKTTPVFMKKFERVHNVFVTDSAAAAGLQLTPAGSEVTGGKSLTKPQPRYPDEAKSARLSGSVVVRLRVDEQGRVTGVKALDCAPAALREASEKAALGATFEPSAVGGKPFPVNTFIVYRFIIM